MNIRDEFEKWWEENGTNSTTQKEKYWEVYSNGFDLAWNYWYNRQ